MQNILNKYWKLNLGVCTKYNTLQPSKCIPGMQGWFNI